MVPKWYSSIDHLCQVLGIYAYREVNANGELEFGSKRDEPVGFDVAERTVSRWMKRAPKTPDPARR